MNSAPALSSPDIAQPPGQVAGDAAMIVTLRLSGEVFGLPVNLVHEIIDPIPVTPVPNAPPHAPGLINVRGSVVPLFDLRFRLDMAAQVPGAHSRIVVLEIQVKGTALRLAIIADAVEDVIDIATATIEPVPTLGAPWSDDFILGALRHQGNLVILLNPETVFRPNSAHSIQDILQ